jgi:predicted transcriptional regulator
MKELTKAEEEIMQVLWELDSAFVKDIINQLPEPKPAYNTVSTIVRILQQKGFVGHKQKGKSHKYFPLITKTAYTKSFMLPQPRA